MKLALFSLLFLLACCSALRSSAVIKSDLLACLRRARPGRAAETLASELEASTLDARPSLAAQSRDHVNGLWELLYSNRAAVLPSALEGRALQLAQIEKVYQNIRITDSPADSEVQNILALKGVFGDAKVVLQHDVEITSNSDPAQMAIYLKELRVSIGGTTLPALPVLPYRINKLLSAGYFDVSFVDEDLRISRGVFGELRVFRRASGELLV